MMVEEIKNTINTNTNINIKTDNHDVTICLNMIVKNESKIITRLFDSVVSFIDCYCICDTGSTDDTIQVIKDYFDSRSIPGKILIEPFKNFCYNRNFALQAAKCMSDYLLLLDADMIFENKNFDKKKLSNLKMYDDFNLLQGSEVFYYQNTRIIRNNGLYKYVGVTHEYIDKPLETKNYLIDKNEAFINDVGDGGSKNNKFERDILLLTKGIEEEPENKIRYTFYLANSYHDIGKYEEAIENYKKRENMGGWNQEVWYSKYRIGCCYKNMGKYSDAIYHWLDAYNYLPERVENLYEIIQYYRNNGKNKLALHFYNLAKNNISEYRNIDSYLFLHKTVYTYKLDYEYSIFSYYNGIRNINDIVVNILNNCSENSTINNLFQNMKFYKDILTPFRKKNMTSEIEIDIDNKATKFYSSSSCLIPNGCDGYYMNQRFVNYYISKSGSYLNCDKHIISLNKFNELTNDFEIVREKMFEQKFEDRRYVGIEDIRIYSNIGNENCNQANILFIGTGYHKNNTIGIVSGVYDINSQHLSSNEIYQNFNNTVCEKNWVFVNYNREPHIIYQWSPLQICKITSKTNFIDIVKTVQMPKIFNHVRGSSCGFNYTKKIHHTNNNCDNIILKCEEKEIWFVVHFVSYESPRHYYHMIAVFDNNMNLLRYSAPFKFEGEEIEYCLSIVVNENHVIMNYSTWDRTTMIGVYSKSHIESKLKYTN